MDISNLKPGDEVLARFTVLSVSRSVTLEVGGAFIPISPDRIEQIIKKPWEPKVGDLIYWKNNPKMVRRVLWRDEKGLLLEHLENGERRYTISWAIDRYQETPNG